MVLRAGLLPRSTSPAQEVDGRSLPRGLIRPLWPKRHFDEVVSRTDNIARTFTNEHGTFQVRDSLFSGRGGFLKFETTWQVTDDGLKLSSVIPMGGA